MDALDTLLHGVTFSMALAHSGPFLHHLQCLAHGVAGIKGKRGRGLEALLRAQGPPQCPDRLQIKALT